MINVNNPSPPKIVWCPMLSGSRNAVIMMARPSNINITSGFLMILSIIVVVFKIYHRLFSSLVALKSLFGKHALLVLSIELLNLFPLVSFMQKFLSKITVVGKLLLS